MARAPRKRPPPTRTHRPPAAARGPIPYDLIAESLRAERYTHPWHVVADWAVETVGMFGVPALVVPKYANPRITIAHAQSVDDLHDAEEAEQHSMDMANVRIELGPAGYVERRGVRHIVGGRRRVIVRMFTWEVDEDAGGVHHKPQWITSGEGLTARAASADHNRYVRAYAEAVAHGVESRLLAVTALEVMWWTMSSGSEFV